MRKKYQLITVASINLLLLFPQVFSYSCGMSYEPESYRMMLFSPAVVVDKGVQPFFYNFKFLNNDFPNGEMDKQENCKEWANYTGNKTLKSDVEEILYFTKPDDFIYAYDNNTLDKDFKGNSFIENLLKKGDKEALKYLRYAKANEFTNFNNPDPWATENEYSDSVLIYTSKYNSLLSVEGEKILEKANSNKNTFLQKRAAFQLMRLARFGNNPSKVNSLFQKYFENSTPSIIDGWAMLHKAASVYNNGQNLQGFYFLSRAFDLSDDKKVAAYTAYTRNPNEQEQVVALGKNAHERAVIHTMNALDNPGKALPAILNVYKEESNSKYLSLLITREINKLEDWIFTPDNTGFLPTFNKYEKGKDAIQEDFSNLEFSNKNRTKDLAYMQELKVFSSDLLKQNTKGDIANVGNLSLAHIALMEGKFSEMPNYLDKIPSNASSKIQVQKGLEQLLCTANTADISTDKVKQQIVDILKNMQLNAKEIENPFKIFASIDLYLSNLYEKKGDIVTAGLLYRKSALPKDHYDSWYNYGCDDPNYVSEYGGCEENEIPYYFHISYFDRKAKQEDIDKLLDFKHNKNKTDFEKYINPRVWADENVFLDLKGTLLFRADELEKAKKTFAAIPDDFWKNTYEFKYYLKTKDITTFNSLFNPTPKDSTFVFSKTKAVDLMQQLKSKIATKPNANDCFLLANAYYNTTYHSNSWMMFNYGKFIYEFNPNQPGGDGFYIFNSSDNKYKDAYYFCSRAYAMYKKAYELADDKELKAKSLFMMHLCEQNKFDLYNPVEYDYNTNESKQKQYNAPHLVAFLKDFKNTETFKFANCPGLQEYVNQRSKN